MAKKPYNPNTAALSTPLPTDEQLLFKLMKARTTLMLGYPFFGSLVVGMKHVLSDAIPTACITPKRIMWNRNFLNMLSQEEVVFVEAHEVMHGVLGHLWRLKTRQRKKWNHATDYVINNTLIKEGIGKMPEMGLHNEALTQAGGFTADGVYALLPDKPEGGGSWDDQGGSPMDDMSEGEDGEGMTNDQRAEAEREWKVKVGQAAQTAKQCGKLSANMERMVGELLQAKVNWRMVLERFVEKLRTDERTFARPNRRFISQGLYLPSVGGEAMGELAFAIDCSGSIGPKELEQYAAELHEIKSRLSPAKMHIVYFDSDVCHYDVFERGDDLTISPHGGGGTAFSPVFSFLHEKGANPLATVFLTDLCCSDFGPAPDYPVLWVSTMDGNAPFGEVVRMHLDV